MRAINTEIFKAIRNKKVTQRTLTCSKSAIETPEQGVKCVQT